MQNQSTDLSRYCQYVYYKNFREFQVKSLSFRAFDIPNRCFYEIVKKNHIELLTKN